MLSLIGALLVLMSSYQLFFSRSGSYEGATLGRVSALEKVVKIKRARSLDWVDAFTDDLVTENQMIYTDDLSSAEVNFTKGQRLVLSENSLIKIRSRGKENELDIGKGSVRATLAGNESIIVRMNGQDYALKGDKANIAINLHDNIGEIGVVNGKVELQKDGKTTSLDESTALVVDGENYSTKVISFVPTSPERQSLVYTGAKSSAVNFTWTGDSGGKIVISKTPDLAEPISQAVKGSSFQTSLTPGNYYWKLTGEKGESLISEFRVVQEAAPEILRPINGEVVDVLMDLNGKGKLRLEWDAETAETFTVEVTDQTTETFTDIRQKSFVYEPKSENISWRVKVQELSRPNAVWSEVSKLRLKTFPFPKEPTNLHPDGVEYQTFNNAGEKIELSWSSAGETMLEIQGPDGNVSEVLSANNYVLNAVKSGSTKWRVRKIDKFSRSSIWSEWKEFTLVDLSGEKSPEGIRRIKLSRPEQEVTFEWESEKGNNVFELSQDRTFEEVIVTKEVSGNQTKLSVPKTGTFYWRSREFRKDGTLNVSEPKKVIIEPIPAPLKPEALPPMEVPLERAPPPTSFLDFFISPVYADDVSGIARLQLPKKENIKFYLLRIFRKGSSDPIVEEKLSEHSFAWRNALPGEYDFQYAVIDFFDRQSPFSDRSILIIKESIGPSRPLLISPIRLEEVKTSTVEFKWGHASNTKKYKLEIFSDESLGHKVHDEVLSAPDFFFKESLPEGNYFWKVTALDEKGDATPSSIGRFKYLPPKMEVIAAPDYPGDWQKSGKSRGHIAWAPSSDTYNFKANDKAGKIDGNTLMGIEARGTIFHPKWIYTGEFLRQSGKVFKKEDYSFMKLTFDTGWIIKSGKNTFSAGPVVGFGLGQSYSIENATVKASGVSGALYGGVARNFYAINPNWDLEGKVAYLLGGLSELEISVNILRSWNDYYLVFGAGFVKREYDKSSGDQSSLKLNVGLGREF